MATTPLITINRPTSLPATPPATPPLIENICIIGTANGGNVATDLPVNTPKLFRRASLGDLPTTASARKALLEAHDWLAIQNTPQTHNQGALDNIADYGVRQTSRFVDDEMIVIRAGNTVGAPSTATEMEAAIQAVFLSESELGKVPGIILVLDMGFTRDSSDDSTFAAALGTQVPWLAELDAAAEELNAIAVIGGSPKMTRAEAVEWGAANQGHHTVAAWPSVRGIDATPDNGKDPSLFYAMAVLDNERRNGGRGCSLNLMDAIGVPGVVPSISQSYLRTTDDASILEAAGITTLINQVGEWKWRGATFNVDLTGGIDNDEDIVSVERVKEEIIAYLVATAIFFGNENLRPVFFSKVTRHVNAYLALLIGDKRIGSGVCRPHPTNRVINTTTAQFQCEVILYAPVRRFVFDIIAPLAS